jgi:hypothetical protein
VARKPHAFAAWPSLCALFRKPTFSDPPRMQITTRLDLIEQSIGIDQPQEVSDQHTERAIGAVGLAHTMCGFLRWAIADVLVRLRHRSTKIVSYLLE